MSTSSTSPINAYRVGPVLTTIAAVLGAAVMFGIGALAGWGATAIFGVTGDGRTAMMLGAGIVLGLGSATMSGRRHLGRRGRPAADPQL